MFSCFCVLYFCVLFCEFLCFFKDSSCRLIHCLSVSMSLTDININLVDEVMVENTEDRGRGNILQQDIMFVHEPAHGWATTNTIPPAPQLTCNTQLVL